MTDEFHIVVDDRERGSGVAAALARLPQVRVSFRRLVLGDYEVSGRLIVERKTLSDFAISILDGRLFEQAGRLSQARVPAVILLEGSGADLASTRLRREALQGALITLSLIYGLPLLRSLGPEESARLIVYAARQMVRTQTGLYPRSGYRPKGKRKRQLWILQGLPGIGPARAERLLDTFGTVEAALRASADELGQVPGIGSETARKVRWIVSEGRGAYGTEAR